MLAAPSESYSKVAFTSRSESDHICESALMGIRWVSWVPLDIQMKGINDDNPNSSANLQLVVFF